MSMNNLLIKKRKKWFFFLIIISLLCLIPGYYLIEWIKVTSTKEYPLLQRYKTLPNPVHWTISYKNRQPAHAAGSDPYYSNSTIQVGEVSSENFYLNFDTKIQGNESLDNFKKYLKQDETVVNLYNPKYQITVDYDADSVAEEKAITSVELKEFKDKILSGTLTTKVNHGWFWYRDPGDPNCKAGDMRGMCVHTFSMPEKTIIIDFEVNIF